MVCVFELKIVSLSPADRLRVDDIESNRVDEPVEIVTTGALEQEEGKEGEEGEEGKEGEGEQREEGKEGKEGKEGEVGEEGRKGEEGKEGEEDTVEFMNLVCPAPTRSSGNSDTGIIMTQMFTCPGDMKLAR